MPTAPLTEPSDVRAEPGWVGWALVAAGAVALGVATSFGQTYLPDQLRSLANSATPWTVAAFALSLVTRRPLRAACVAGLSLVGLVVGYELASRIRLDVGLSGSWRLFWTVCALVVGPVVGYLGALARARSEPARVLLVGGLSGLAIGEGVHGLVELSTTTSSVYWWISVGAGAVGLVWFGWVRRTVGLAAATTGVAAVAALAFTVVYSRIL